MGADHLDVEPPYSRQPATLAAAARYLVRSGNADLLPVLGLAPEEPDAAEYEVRAGSLRCRTCKRRTQGDGVCRRAGCGGAR